MRPRRKVVSKAVLDSNVIIDSARQEASDGRVPPSAAQAISTLALSLADGCILSERALLELKTAPSRILLEKLKAKGCVISSAINAEVQTNCEEFLLKAEQFGRPLSPQNRQIDCALLTLAKAEEATLITKDKNLYLACTSLYDPEKCINTNQVQEIEVTEGGLVITQ